MFSCQIVLTTIGYTALGFEFYINNTGNKKAFTFILLGDYGVFTGSSGLKMVYVSGKQKMMTKPNDIGFTMEAIKSIEVQVGNSSAGVDILLTSQWPKSAENLAVPLVCYVIFKASLNLKIVFFLNRKVRIVKSSDLLCFPDWLRGSNLDTILLDQKGFTTSACRIGKTAVSFPYTEQNSFVI